MYLLHIISIINYIPFFLLLWISSTLFHIYPNIYTNLLDKIIIFVIFMYGGYLFYNKMYSQVDKKQIFPILFILLSFFSTIFLYFFVHIQKENYTLQLQYNLHSLLHIIGSIGHHLIVLL